MEIVNIIANDADRDGNNLVINKCLNMFSTYIIILSVIYHTLEYTYDQRDTTLRQYFQIDENLGYLVSDVTPGFVIDRDIGMEFFEILVNVEDNVRGTGGKNSAQITVPIRIADINDHAPDMPLDFMLTISENTDSPVIFFFILF